MGVISGIVTSSSGSPVSGASVSAYFSGFSGGVTDRVYSDSNGRFMLTYTGSSTAEIIYCNGQEAAKNVPSGSNTVHLVAR
jgi:hypothetical protein